VNNLPRLDALLRQTWTTTGFALKRLLTQRLLSIAAIIGLMIASGFIFSIPLYADAIYFRLFREELFAGRESQLAYQPVDYAPLAFNFELKGVGQDSPQWEDAGEVDSYLSHDGPGLIGLPVLQSVRRFHTDFIYMYPPLEADRPETQYYVASVRPAFISPLEETVQIVSGRAPKAAEVLGTGAVEGMVHEDLVLDTGVQVGDVYYLRRNNVEIPVTITGLWRPVNPDAPYWDPQVTSWLLVDETSYASAIGAAVRDELFSSMWSVTLDGANLHSGDIVRLQSNIDTVKRRAAALLAKTNLISSPLEALARYQKNAPSLTFLLFAFSVPILGLIVVFIGLVAGLFVGQQRAEMAILRSRGAGRPQVVWISLLQGILLGAVALTGGALLGSGIAHAIGRAHSFLNFSGVDALRVIVTLSVVGYGLAGISLILLVMILLPTFGASENTIVTYKQERARMLRPPWWQRYWLDIVLLVPAGYGLWTLQRQSTQAATGAEGVPNPLLNPLLLLVPAVCIFAATLFALRLIPLLMATIARVLRPTKNVGLLMAARYLSRTPAFYTAPLILLILTLGLSAFTASLARTLDSQLEQQKYYQVGSDMSIQELGTTANDDPSSPDATFTFPPVEEHSLIEGVRAAARVGRYAATTILADGAVEGTYLGVDMQSFTDVAYWQKDFAPQSLGALMNILSRTPSGVLIPASLLQEKRLQVGDPISISVKTTAAGESAVLDSVIAGTFDLFPTWYPENGTFFVGSLEELYFQAGNEFPHEVWLRTDPGADPEGIVYAVRGYSIMLDEKADQSRLVETGLNTFVAKWSSAQQEILTQQRRPERQGLFGLLSAGFVASALLTVLGFMLYALFSFRRRFIELGMLRAIGLSVRQMVGLLAAELASLILLGIGVGTILGVIASRLFVPFLQMGTTAHAQYPPFQIEIAWMSILQIYVLFGALFVSALGVLVALLVRMKIFQAVKLGESI
jgi:putative ABC transport system permease protein